MKGFKAFLLILIFLSCIFYAKFYNEAMKNNIVFYQIIPFKSNLSAKLVENFFCNDEFKKTAAQKQIKEIVLNDLGYNDWVIYSDYIEILLYPMDVIDDNIEELVITMNLSKDIGVLGIYKKYNEIYVLNFKIENLTNINNIISIKNNTSDKVFLIVEQVLDEKTGAYFTDNYIQIFTKSGLSFIEVFRQSLDYSAYYYEKWTNPSQINPKWFKIAEKSVIDHITNDHENITLFISKVISKYEGTDIDEDNMPNEYKLVEQKDFNIKYTWDNEYNSFILGKGEIISNKKIVGILEDTSKTADYLLNLTGKCYKVIDKDNSILYIDEDNLRLINSNSEVIK